MDFGDDTDRLEAMMELHGEIFQKIEYFRSEFMMSDSEALAVLTILHEDYHTLHLLRKDVDDV